MAILIQQLLKKGLIDKEQAASLEFEAKERRKKEEELLIEKNVVTEDFLLSMPATILH